MWWETNRNTEKHENEEKTIKLLITLSSFTNSFICSFAKWIFIENL